MVVMNSAFVGRGAGLGRGRGRGAGTVPVGARGRGSRGRARSPTTGIVNTNYESASADNEYAVAVAHNPNYLPSADVRGFDEYVVPVTFNPDYGEAHATNDPDDESTTDAVSKYATFNDIHYAVPNDTGVQSPQYADVNSRPTYTIAGAPASPRPNPGSGAIAMNRASDTDDQQFC